MSKPSLTVTADFTKNFKEIIDRFKNDDILVGIPEQDGPRDESTPINNATLLAINHFGSPANNIPPRPVLTIGIRNVQDAIAEGFKMAAKTALSKGRDALTQIYERIGFTASSACKKVINDQDSLAPPSEATLKARKYLTAAGFKGEKALLVTGQMRNAITHVVQSKWAK